MKPILRCHIALVLCLLAAVSGRAAQMLSGHVPPEVKRLQPLGRMDTNRTLQLTFGLPLRQGSELTNLLQDLYDPKSPRFHHYLTAAQFAAEFGPATNDYAALKKFARAHAFTVSSEHGNRTLLTVTAKAGDIEQALHVRFQRYRHPTENREFFSADADPTLDLTVPLLGIRGLDDFTLPHPMSLRTNAFQGYTDTNAQAYPTGSGPSGYFVGKDFRDAYAPGVALNGSGQSIALFELDGYYPGDISKYEVLAQLPNVTLTNILLDGFSGTPGVNNIEVALDIDMAIAMAPGLYQVMVYEGNSPDDILNQIATDNQAKQISSSWGFGPQVDALRDQIYLQFAAQGQSLFQASGDSGAYLGVISAPSDDPNVTVVGGTTLETVGLQEAWSNETAWNGSGGGVSTTFSIPYWQQGIDMSSNHGSTTMRNIPDVACEADVLIWLIAQNGNQGPIGGSSASAPLWAGFMALVNQQAQANERSTVGFLNPALYELGKSANAPLAFHDIVQGNNTNSSSPTNYFAVPGYDLVTGWGSPTGSNLIRLLAGPLEALSVGPITNLLASGTQGGPFSPASWNFVLTNVGSNAVSWSAGANVPWLSLSSVFGTITPGGFSTVVMAGLNSNAASLPVGQNTGIVWFTNLAANTVQSRFVIVSVTPSNSGAPQFLTQPLSQTVPPAGPVTPAATVNGHASLSYQWRCNGTNLADGTNITGSLTSSLTITSFSVSNTGTYTLLASNSFGIALSSNAVLTLLNLTASGVTKNTLYAFADGSDGASPNELMQASDGNLYGTTQLGGTSDAGVIFRLLPNGTVSTIYQFNYPAGDGFNPTAALVQAGDGALYGTTEYGGSADYGTLFRITTNGAYSSVISFNGGLGEEPYRKMILGADGKLYGTCVGGGAQSRGTAFQATTNGGLATLFSFGSASGLNPNDLVQSSDGTFFGTAFDGGANGAGTIFSLSTNNAFHTLLSFGYTNGGYLPFAGLVLAPDGFFYGTTYEGGDFGFGTVFKMTASGVVTTLHSFDSTNGSYPGAGLTLGSDGNLYGTTTYGGPYDDGTVFRIAPNGGFTTLALFDGFDGANPDAAVTFGADGNLYGTAQNGGPANSGVIFKLSVNSPGLQITTQPQSQNAFVGQTVVFDVAVLGNAPVTYQWKRNGGNLSDAGSISGSGTRVLTLHGVTEADSAVYSVLVNSTLSDGASLGVILSPPQITGEPISQTQTVGGSATFTVTAVGDVPLGYQWLRNGVSLSDGGQFSGSMTSALTISNLFETNSGSYSVLVSNAVGQTLSDAAVLTVYAASASGTAMSALHSFAGAIPNGLTAASNGLIYGTTQGSNGTIFTVTTNGIFSTIATFAGTNGAQCLAPMTEISNSTFLGTTQFGGSNGVGDVFHLDASNTLTDFLSFSTNDVAIEPYTALTADGAGNFYGAAQNASSNNGVIYKVSPSGSYQLTHAFNGAEGTSAVDALALGQDGNFYGMTGGGAAHNDGGIFRMTPSGALTNLYSFTGGSDGFDASGKLALNIDGNFYGVTRRNAISGFTFYGTLFKVTPSGQLTTLYSLNYSDGAYPFGGLLLASDGNFYGTTLTGFASPNGTLFRLTPAGAFTTLLSFNGGDDGASPESALVQGLDGSLYGTTTSGGLYGSGTMFRLSFTGAPQITMQPASQTNVIGGSALLNVAVFGAPTLGYQWFQNGVALPGATSRVLAFNNLSAANAGSYSLLVTNGLGSITSSTAVLTLRVPPAFQSITQSAGFVYLTWGVTSGLKYQLQSSTNLATTNWVNLGASVTASNNVMSASDSLTNVQKFYRVLQLP